MSLPVLIVRASEGQSEESPAFDQSESSDARRLEGRGGIASQGKAKRN